MAVGDALVPDEPAAALLGDAFRANTSLTALSLTGNCLWDNPAAGAVLCAALTGHPRLHTIDLSGNHVHGNAVERAALGALVAANAPALQQLNVSNCLLRDAGLGPLVEALRHNTHLRVLNCDENGMSEAFARRRLLPAVRANTGLRTLTAASSWLTPELYGEHACEEAAALVAARALQPRA
jgi:Ran GTPase-activating protein (RanGAP) involved in mRNA processing and transport